MRSRSLAAFFFAFFAFYVVVVIAAGAVGCNAPSYADGTVLLLATESDASRVVTLRVDNPNSPNSGCPEVDDDAAHLGDDVFVLDNAGALDDRAALRGGPICANITGAVDTSDAADASGDFTFDADGTVLGAHFAGLDVRHAARISAGADDGSAAVGDSIAITVDGGDDVVDVRVSFAGIGAVDVARDGNTVSVVVPADAAGDATVIVEGDSEGAIDGCDFAGCDVRGTFVHSLPLTITQ